MNPYHSPYNMEDIDACGPPLTQGQNLRSIYSMAMNLKTVFLFLSLLVCSYSVPVFAQEAEFAFVLKGKGNPFWKSIVSGIRETSDALKVTSVVYQLDNDQASESQLNICQTALEREPKVLVLGASTKTVGIQCYKEAARRGIIFGDIDSNVTVQDAKDAGLKMAFSVGSDNYEIGKLAANFARTVSPSETPNVLILAGLTGSIVSNHRVDGFRDQLKVVLPQARIVGPFATDWDRMKAANVTADVLQRADSLDLIYSASDMMTAGVIETLKAQGKSSIPIVSVDANEDIRKAILAGRVSASVAQLPYLMGKRAVELAVEATTSLVEERTEHTATPVITRELLEKNEDPNLQYVR